MILAIEDVNERIYTLRYDGDSRTFASFTARPTRPSPSGNADEQPAVRRRLGPRRGREQRARSCTRTRTAARASGTAPRPTTGLPGAASRRSRPLTRPTGSSWSGTRATSCTWSSRTQADDLRAWKWTAGAWTVTTPSLPVHQPREQQHQPERRAARPRDVAAASGRHHGGEADVVRGGAGGRRGAALVADGLGARQPRLPPLPRAVGRGAVDAAHRRPHSRPRLLAPRAGLRRGATAAS